MLRNIFGEKREIEVHLLLIGVSISVSRNLCVSLQ